MGEKRPPSSSPHLSKVIYPSALYSLEREEIFPYERFAYRILALAIEVFHDKGLPEDIPIDFANDPALFLPWRINAGIRCRLDANGTASSFEFLIPELLPGIGYLYCFSFAAQFVQQPPEKVRAALLTFFEVADASVKAYKLGGISFALRAGYEKAGFISTSANELNLIFDLLVSHIGYHEIAHGYANLLGAQEDNPVRKRSFELVADLLAAQWLYKGMIVNTPDTVAYREYMGDDSYRSSIYRNCMFVQRSYFTLLGLFALAGAQRTGTTVTLEGGTTHPPGMQRHLLQHMHFMTLVKSNFDNVLTADDLKVLDDDWGFMISAFHQAGVISSADFNAGLDSREADTLEAAADVIEQKAISELNHAVFFLREAREILHEAELRRVQRTPV